MWFIRLCYSSSSLGTLRSPARLRSPPLGPPVSFFQSLAPRSVSLKTGGLTEKAGLTPGFSCGSFCCQCPASFHCANRRRPASGHEWPLRRSVRDNPLRVFSRTLSPSGWTFQPVSLRDELSEIALGRGKEAGKPAVKTERSLTSEIQTPAPQLRGCLNACG